LREKEFRDFSCSINIEHFRMKKSQKSQLFFSCETCDYFTSSEKDFLKHSSTSKHKNRTKLNILEQKIPKNPELFVCKFCQKSYHARNSLWYHQKKCGQTTFLPEKSSQHNETTIHKDDLIIQLLKQNSELIKENADFKNMMIKVIENGTHNTTYTNSHNKSFNLNFFLNETCKNAMNITQFVDSIKLQLSDLMDVGELGYVEGISKIIVQNLNNLDETERPIHCTDRKRETFYVKDANQWEKEDDNKSKLKKAIKRVANKNIHLLPTFRENFPEYNNSSMKISDTYDKIVVESMVTDHDKDNKIIKKISNATMIQKLL
jgi:hypothetical protein